MKSDNVIHFRERAGCPGGGKGILISVGGAAHCLNAVSRDILCIACRGMESTDKTEQDVREKDGATGCATC